MMDLEELDYVDEREQKICLRILQAFPLRMLTFPSVDRRELQRYVCAELERLTGQTPEWVEGHRVLSRLEEAGLLHDDDESEDTRCVLVPHRRRYELQVAWAMANMPEELR